MLNFMSMVYINLILVNDSQCDSDEEVNRIIWNYIFVTESFQHVNLEHVWN